jgi:hypothetical protein
VQYPSGGFVDVELAGSAIGPAVLPLPLKPRIDNNVYAALARLSSFLCVLVPTSIDDQLREPRLLTANVLFTSMVHVGYRANSRVKTLRCFRTLWPVLCMVTPVLRGRVRHLTQQDVGDFLFSLSREYARRSDL